MIPLAAAAVVGLLALRASGSAASLDMRGGFTQTSMRLIGARPVLGVGVGRYYSLSSLALPPSLAWWYGRENAHDYFLQIGAELGLAGLAAFVWLLAAVLAGAWRAGRGDPVVAAAVAGTAGYLITCLAGHPFLVVEAVVPFWLVLGRLAAVPVSATQGGGTTRRALAAGAAAALLLTAPIGLHLPLQRILPEDDGFTAWRTDAGGVEFRTVRRFASLFLVPAVERVEIPIRARIRPPATSGTISVNGPGIPARNLVVGSDWSVVVVSLPAPDPLVPRLRINFAVIRGSATDASEIDVGRPKIAHTR